MSLFRTLGIGRSAVRASALGVEVTGHNVANASTEGYSRQRVGLTAAAPLRRRGHHLGRGVAVLGVGRGHNALVQGRLRSQVATEAASSTRADVLRVAELALGDLESGLPAGISKVFAAIEAASSDPGNADVRAEVGSTFRAFAGQVRNAAVGLEDAGKSVREQLAADVEQANGLLEEIAALNGQLGQGAGSPDLLDRRDAILDDLAALSGATYDLDPTGRATVFIGDHAAVSSARARSLSLVQADDGSVSIELQAEGGGVDVTGGIGGAVGGAADALGTLVGMASGLDHFAEVFVLSVAAANDAGFTDSGVPGGSLLTTSSDRPAATLTWNSEAELAFAGAVGSGVGDGANIQSFLDLRDLAAVDGKTAEGFLHDLVVDTGSALAEAEASAESANAAVADLRAVSDAASGVDLDEEAARLIEFQASYQAALRIVEATNSMLQELMGAIR